MGPEAAVSELASSWGRGRGQVLSAPNIGVVEGKYQALTAFLVSRSEQSVELTFAELDRLVGLPASARKYPAWWANSRTAQPQARFWLDAGRRAVPDFNAGRVRFVIGAATVSSPHIATARHEWALIATGEVIHAEIRFEWLDAGDVSIDDGPKPVFPSLPARPGVYRFTLTSAEADLIGVYIGESDNLSRRMGNYRNPGPTQPTNQRLNAQICELITSGGAARVSASVEATVDGEVLDLAARPARLLAENAALVRAAQMGLPVANL